MSGQTSVLAEGSSRTLPVTESVLTTPTILENDETLDEKLDDAEDGVRIIDWDGENDPENPFNWARRRKWLSCITVSLLTFISPLSATYVTGSQYKIANHFGVSDGSPLVGLLTSIFCASSGTLAKGVAAERAFRDISACLCFRTLATWTAQRDVRPCARAANLSGLVHRVQLRLFVGT